MYKHELNDLHVYIVISGCENSGDFQSITHSVSTQRRSRRSVISEEYSYPEDKPRISKQISDQTEIRLEGLEDTIGFMSDTINSLLKQVSFTSLNSCGESYLYSWFTPVFFMEFKVQRL